MVHDMKRFGRTAESPERSAYVLFAVSISRKPPPFGASTMRTCDKKSPRLR